MGAWQLSHPATLQIGLYILSVGVSHEYQINYAWALALLSSHMHLELGCEQGIDANMGAK